MPKFSVSWSGLKRLRSSLRARDEDYLRAAEAALYVEGERVMSKAKRLTPVDTGVLRSSGHVRPPVREGSRVYVELGFGGPAGAGERGNLSVFNVVATTFDPFLAAGEIQGAAERSPGYAVYVHEDLAAHHTVGQAKYLETPVNAARTGFSRRFARTVLSRLPHG